MKEKITITVYLTNVNEILIDGIKYSNKSYKRRLLQLIAEFIFDRKFETVFKKIDAKLTKALQEKGWSK